MPPTTTAVVESTELEPFPADDRDLPRGTWDARTDPPAGHGRGGLRLRPPLERGRAAPLGVRPAPGRSSSRLSCRHRCRGRTGVRPGRRRTLGGFVRAGDAAEFELRRACRGTDVHRGAAGVPACPPEGGHRLGAARDGAGRGDHDSHHGHLLAQTVSLDLRCADRALPASASKLSRTLSPASSSIRSRSAGMQPTASVVAPRDAAVDLAGRPPRAASLIGPSSTEPSADLDISPAQVDFKPGSGRTARERQAKCRLLIHRDSLRSDRRMRTFTQATVRTWAIFQQFRRGSRRVPESSLVDYYSRTPGGVAEWLNAAVSKTVMGGLRPSRVRIPPPPLNGRVLVAGPCPLPGRARSWRRVATRACRMSGGPRVYWNAGIARTTPAMLDPRDLHRPVHGLPRPAAAGARVVL